MEASFKGSPVPLDHPPLRTWVSVDMPSVQSRED